MLLMEEILHYHPDKRELLFPAHAVHTPEHADAVPHGVHANGALPSLRYEATDQAARFRQAMRANENGHVGPKPWDSMPNQTMRNTCMMPSGNRAPVEVVAATITTNGMNHAPDDRSANALQSSTLANGTVTERQEPNAMATDAATVVAAGQMTDDEDLQRVDRFRSGESATSAVVWTVNRADTATEIRMDAEMDAAKPAFPERDAAASQQLSVRDAHVRTSVTGESMELDSAGQQ
jgi:hypothetical protein